MSLLFQLKGAPAIEKAFRKKVKARLRARVSETPDYAKLVTKTLALRLGRFGPVESFRFHLWFRQFEGNPVMGVSHVVGTAHRWGTVAKAKVKRLRRVGSS